MAYTTIDKGSKYFNTITYTGTGASLAITGVGFQPDWVWIKGRSGATDHGLYDAVRGIQKDLVSNSSAAETTQTTGLTAFGSDGFTVGALAKLNTSTATYVSWNWLASNTTASNASGSITSTVSANTTSGFSIVSYTGTGVNATVGHGLGVAPKMVIVKSRSISQNWATYHVGLTSAAYRVTLDSTSAEASQPTIFNSTAPTSSVFSIGTNVETNSSGATYIAYCFADVKGYSRFGKYTGNGNADGTFVYTGFKPAFVMIKNSTTAGDSWQLWDNKRLGYNVDNNPLFPNTSGVEGTSDISDILSNGFKMRTTASGFNTSGDKYIYMAFAENPFVSSKGLPCTAR